MRLDYPGELLEVIVVDNNSTDRTAEIIKRYPVKYIFEDKKHSAAVARNRGLAEASGEFVAFTDGDCVVDSSWLKNLIDAFENKPTAGGAGSGNMEPGTAGHGTAGHVTAGCGGRALSYEPAGLIEKYLDYAYSKHMWRAPTLSESVLPYLWTANAVYRRDVLFNVGLFDEAFIGATVEDAELSWRVLLSGYKLKYVPEAVVRLVHENNFLSFLLQETKRKYYSSRLIKKYRAVVEFPSPIAPREFLEFFKRAFKCCRDMVLRPHIFHFFDLVFEISTFAGRFFGWVAGRPISCSIDKLNVKNKMICQNVDGSILLSPIESGVTYEMDGIGYEIWRLRQDGIAAADIAVEIAKKYNGDIEIIKKDIKEFLAEF